MKRTLIHLLVLLLLVSACKEENDYDGKHVYLKGRITANTNQPPSSLRTTGEPTLADAAYLLVYYGYGYDLVSLNDSTFNASVQQGNATALLFLTQDYRYIGHLFAGGLNCLPLVDLEDNLVIDLNTLYLDGHNVLPTHDPIGREIQLSNAERAVLKETGAFFEDLATNMDTDLDGKPDILSDRQLLLTSGFEPFPPYGRWGLPDKPAVPYDTTGLRIVTTLTIMGKATMLDSLGYEHVRLRGPLDHPYENILWQMNYTEGMTSFDVTFFRNNPFGHTDEGFERGTYLFSLNGTTEYTVRYANTNARLYLVFGIPTLYVDEAGMVSRVDIEWKTLTGEPIDPARIINNLGLVFHQEYLSTPQQRSYIQWGTLNAMEPSMREIKAFDRIDALKPVKYSDVTQVMIGYVDILGNRYTLRYDHPDAPYDR